MKYAIPFFIAAVNFFLPRVFAQPQLWEIYSTSNQPFVNVAVDKYESDSLYVKFMDRTIVLHQDSIQYLVQRHTSRFGVGFLIGAVVGGIFFNLSSQGSGNFFSELGRLSVTAFGIVIGGTIGGVIGLAQGTNTKYRLEKMNTEEKRKLLSKLFH